MTNAGHQIGVAAADNMRDPPGRWRALAVLAAAMVLAMTTWFSATAVLPQLRIRWELSSTASSWLTISVQVGFVLGAIGSAVFNLADVLPPRRLILIGAGGAAAANLTLLWASGLAGAIPARLLTGASLALVYPPALKAMATWFRAGRGTALGIMVGALTLGSAVPHLANGVASVDPNVVILLTSALTLAGGLLADRVGRDGPYPFPEAVFEPGQIRRVVRNRRFLLATAGYFGHMWELYAMWAWIALFLRSALAGQGVGDPARVASILAFAMIGAGALGCVVGGLISDRWGRSESTIIAMSCSGLAAATIGFLDRGPTLLIVVVGVFWGFWVVADSAQFSTIVTEVAEPRFVGTAVTLQLAVGFTLTVVTIWLVPVVRDTSSWGWAFLVLAAGPALGIVAMWRLRSEQRRPGRRPQAVAPSMR